MAKTQFVARFLALILIQLSAFLTLFKGNPQEQQQLGPTVHVRMRFGSTIKAAIAVKLFLVSLLYIKMILNFSLFVYYLNCISVFV